jgi:hypothetical protein
MQGNAGVAMGLEGEATLGTLNGGSCDRGLATGAGRHGEWNGVEGVGRLGLV